MILIKPGEHHTGTESKRIEKDKTVLEIMDGGKQTTIIGDDD